MASHRKLKYLAIGAINTLFGYFTGVFLYNLLSQKLDIFFIGAFSNIICITFSFVSYKLFVFKTVGRWIAEYTKAYLVYGTMSIIGIGLLWFYVDVIMLDIWIAQGLVIVSTVLLSYMGHSRVTFKRKEI